METINDLAKLFYWGCVIWPLVGMIGIFACEGQAARARCHFIVSIILIIITACSAYLADDFFLSAIWSSDGLTRFLRFAIAVGAGISTILLRFWAPRSLFFSKEDKRLLWNLMLFHLLTAVSLLAVGVNNLFLSLLFIVILAALLMSGCIFNQGSSSIKAGWAYFRLVLLFAVMAVVAAFLLASVPIDNAPYLAKFSSVLLSFSLVLIAGLFPMSLPFLGMTMELPLTLGGIGSFILSVPVIATFLRLYQIPAYEPPENLLIILVIVSLCFVILNEQNRQRSSLCLSSLFLVALSILGGIFANHIEGIYSACLFIIALVVFAPLGYMMSQKQRDHQEACEGWVMFALSGLPPIGIFWACAVLFAYLMQTMPMIVVTILGLFLIRGYILFQKGRNIFFLQGMFSKEIQLILGIIAVQTVLLPLLTSSWLQQIAVEFVKYHGGSGS
ncbi:hypothetical protein [Commensalibacter papalotli (ex Servin-Garciduenas et al. 2014)]|uniref:NADH:quinone oxidoreductase/Mrp antiporter membrane subunit domain-containing protein n=1 Tax=Commensalibacter papalotli (ex Servin-Garciduenas et al. 2014) TaxID=1208583 RepID=W7E594_9PROT|nr:hypothetical protein [Commensalibacter papalotli (ex Servin-Garciduenas et al. 2014)]EUK18251.1 hypothetical protein COMX_00835 [Commensalibacter papalotli (ex Servin-Garciduenas et al. 2014)]